jgi:hypothetical protein
MYMTAMSDTAPEYIMSVIGDLFRERQEKPEYGGIYLQGQ